MFGKSSSAHSHDPIALLRLQSSLSCSFVDHREFLTEYIFGRLLSNWDMKVLDPTALFVCRQERETDRQEEEDVKQSNDSATAK